MANPSAATKLSRRQARGTILLATAAQVPDLDEEGQLLLAALEAAGLAAQPAVWTDEDVDWSRADLVVVRSTWDYTRRRTEFMQWVDHVAAQTMLANPPDLLRWSTDKVYLNDLHLADVPVVPSLFLNIAAEHPLLDVEHVIKPSVSAGSLDTARVAAGDRARSLRHMQAIIDSGRTALLQPYMTLVEEFGETALIYIDGRFSHALRKAAILTDGDDQPVKNSGLYVEEEMSPRTASPEELALGERALKVACAGSNQPPLYARIDLLPGTSGPLVIEVELAEPSLFLEHVEGTAHTLATAIARRLGL